MHSPQLLRAALEAPAVHAKGCNVNCTNVPCISCRQDWGFMWILAALCCRLSRPHQSTPGFHNAGIHACRLRWTHCLRWATGSSVDLVKLCCLHARLERRAHISSPGRRGAHAAPCCPHSAALPAFCTLHCRRGGRVHYPSPTLGCRLSDTLCPALLLQSHMETVVYISSPCS